MKLVLVFLIFVSSCATEKPAKETPKVEPESAPATEPLKPGSADFWDNAYNRETYVYGTKPNEHFAAVLKTLEPGVLLLPGEGEGRNAVWAAQNGWTVDAFDFSPKAKEKALALAEQSGVELNYWVADFAKPNLQKKYDVIAIIYLHLPKDIFGPGMKAMVDGLKPGGTLLMEVFAEGHEKTGAAFGPKSADVLYTLDEIRAQLGDLEPSQFETLEITLDEGMHQGPGKVVRVVATKPK